MEPSTSRGGHHPSSTDIASTTTGEQLPVPSDRASGGVVSEDTSDPIAGGEPSGEPIEGDQTSVQDMTWVEELRKVLDKADTLERMVIAEHVHAVADTSTVLLPKLKELVEDIQQVLDKHPTSIQRS
ncbi:unnamed protein product [Calypogeia fissa]